MKLSPSAPPKMPPRPAMVTTAPAVSDVWQPILTNSNQALFKLNEQNGPYGALLVPNTAPTAEFEHPGAWVTPLSDIMVLKVSGEDALTFLQGQLTNNLEALEDGMAQRTGLCSPKGRLLADFIAARVGTHYLLLVSSEMAESIHKRLAMFVLRAKVNIENVTQATPPIGILGAPGDTPGHWPALMQLHCDEQNRLFIGLEAIETGDRSQSRVIVLTPSAELVQDFATYRSQAYATVATAWWHSTEALAGTARIGLATSDAFVPQMINFELIGGVSFQKGCFPGQEVVARTQYLGKLKRRLQAGRISGAAQTIPGTEVLDASGAAVGTVILAGPGEAVGLPGQQILLFEIRLAALEEGGHLRIGDEAVTMSPLPYEIPVAERFERPDL